MDYRGMFQKLIIALLVVVVAYGAYMVFSSAMAGPQAGATPSPGILISTVTPQASIEPPQLQLTMITAPACEDCFAIDAFAYVLQEQGAELKIEKFAYDSDEGKKIVKEYNITKAPTIIFSGEIDRVEELEGLLNVAGTKVGDKWVLRDISPPYLDVESGKIVGRVSIKTIYTDDCESCNTATVPISSAAVNYSALGDAFRQIGVGVSEDVRVPANSIEGINIIGKYGLTRLPAIILSEDIEAYPELARAMDNVGYKAEDGNYVIRMLNPPFYNITSGEEEGLLTIVYIKAGNYCPDCYDYRIHTSELAGMGVIAAESYYYDFDSSIGKNYTQNFNITKIPTVLISPEIIKYPAFMLIYNQLGRILPSGWFLFDKFEVLEGGTYFDIPSNKSVTVAIQPAA